MGYILSAAHVQLPFLLTQEAVMDFSREIFEDSFKNIERLLKAFKNGQVENRYFSNHLEWYKEQHTFAERNQYVYRTSCPIWYGSSTKMFNE